MIFVFGSNQAGYHGAGAAKFALLHEGAIMHQGYGRQGNSFAIPTKDHMIRTLPIESVAVHVNSFIQYALEHKDETFKVTRIGCGLAGYKDEDIAPLFVGSPVNCQFDLQWGPFLGMETVYWGTM